MSGATQNCVERLFRKIDGNKVDVPNRSWKLSDMGTLIILRCRMIDLEYFNAAQLGHAPCTSVVTCAEYDELLCAIGDRILNGFVDGGGTKRHDVGHHTR